MFSLLHVFYFIFLLAFRGITGNDCGDDCFDIGPFLPAPNAAQIPGPATDSKSTPEMMAAGLYVSNVCNFEYSQNVYEVDGAAGSGQSGSSIAKLSDSRFVLVWQSDREGSDTDILAQLYDVDPKTGAVTKFYDYFSVNTELYFDQMNPKVVAVGDSGAFVVTYQSSVLTLDSLPTRQFRILFQMFDINGNAIGKEYQVTSDMAGYAREETVPSIAALDGDNPGFVVTWLEAKFSQLQNLEPQNMMAQLFSIDGISRSSAFQVNTVGTSVIDNHDVTGLANGYFVATWTQQDVQYRMIYALMFGGNGHFSGEPFLVSSPQGDAYEPSVAKVHEDGSFVISWSADTGDIRGDIYFKRYNGNAQPVGEIQLANTFRLNLQTKSFVTPRPNGTGYAILWQSLFQDGDDYGVFGQFFDNQDQIDGLEFRLNTDGIGAQTHPTGFIGANNQMIVSWTQDSNRIFMRSFICRQDCLLSNWSEWARCSTECGGGIQQRQRNVIYPAQRGGRQCENTLEERPCNQFSCTEAPCRMCLNETCYLRIVEEMTYDEAKQECRNRVCPDSSNCLADVENKEQRNLFIQSLDNNETWIESWEGNTYGDICLSLSRYGAITVPLGGCQDKRSAICQYARPQSC